MASGMSSKHIICLVNRDVQVIRVFYSRYGITKRKFYWKWVGSHRIWISRSLVLPWTLDTERQKPLLYQATVKAAKALCKLFTGRVC